MHYLILRQQHADRNHMNCVVCTMRTISVYLVNMVTQVNLLPHAAEGGVEFEKDRAWAV